jgi:hypothetical protein
MIGFFYLSKFKSADVPTEKSTVAILQPLPISPASLFNKPRCDKATFIMDDCGNTQNEETLTPKSSTNTRIVLPGSSSLPTCCE